jgi:hypothetical protein
MKLSEAIREGAKLRPQAFGRTFLETASGVLTSCAIAAALEATGYDPLRPLDLNARDLFRETFQSYWTMPAMPCPHQHKGRRPRPCPDSGQVYGMLLHLNDTHEWSREAIADWVETIEKPSSEASASALSQKIR